MGLHRSPSPTSHMTWASITAMNSAKFTATPINRPIAANSTFNTTFPLEDITARCSPSWMKISIFLKAKQIQVCWGKGDNSFIWFQMQKREFGSRARLNIARKIFALHLYSPSRPTESHVCCLCALNQCIFLSRALTWRKMKTIRSLLVW